MVKYLAPAFPDALAVVLDVVIAEQLVSALKQVRNHLKQGVDAGVRRKVHQADVDDLLVGKHLDRVLLRGGGNACGQGEDKDEKKLFHAGFRHAQR